MKIGICSKENDLKSLVDDRFGRAEKFIVYDTETSDFFAVENTAKTEASGAGGSAVKILSKNNVEVILAPEIGPKAMDAINGFEMDAYNFGDSKTVEEAIEKYKNGNLKKFITSSTESHSGLRRA